MKFLDLEARNMPVYKLYQVVFRFLEFANFGGSDFLFNPLILTYEYFPLVDCVQLVVLSF
jgi:hypothetical protein